MYEDGKKDKNIVLVVGGLFITFFITCFYLAIVSGNLYSVAFDAVQGTFLEPVLSFLFVIICLVLCILIFMPALYVLIRTGKKFL